MPSFEVNVNILEEYHISVRSEKWLINMTNHMTNHMTIRLVNKGYGWTQSMDWLFLLTLSTTSVFTHIHTIMTSCVLQYFSLCLCTYTYNDNAEPNSTLTLPLLDGAHLVYLQSALVKKFELQITNLYPL